MCTPTVTHLPIVSDGPCGFTVRAYNDACSAWSLKWSWRVGLANILRTWADKAEKSKSLTIVAFGPSCIAWDDVTHAATFGISGATKYLNDIWRERTATGPAISFVIAPSKSIPGPEEK